MCGYFDFIWTCSKRAENWCDLKCTIAKTLGIACRDSKDMADSNLDFLSNNEGHIKSENKRSSIFKG